MLFRSKNLNKGDEELPPTATGINKIDWATTTPTGMAFQHWAGATEADLAIDTDTADTTMTIAELLAKLTTSADEEIKFVEAFDATNGELGSNRTAAAAVKIVVTIGNGTDKITITVDADSGADVTARYSVTFDPTMVKVVDNATSTEITESPILAVNAKTFAVTPRDGYKIESIKDSDDNPVTLTGTPATTLTVGTKDIIIKAVARTAADDNTDAVAAAKTILDTPLTLDDYGPASTDDLTAEKTLADVLRQVKAALTGIDVEVSAEIDSTTPFSKKNVKYDNTDESNTSVTLKYDVTVTAGDATYTKQDLTIKTYYTKDAADVMADAAKAAVAAAIDSKYSVATYQTWVELKDAITAAINDVEGISGATVDIATGGPDFGDGSTEWKAGISFTIEYGFTYDDGASGTGVTNQTKLISIVQ